MGSWWKVLTSSTLDLNHPLRVPPLLEWKIQSNSVNTDTEGGIESVRINGVSVLSRLNLEKM